MEEAIELLVQDQEFLYSSRIVIAVLYNVLGDPLNEKYRRLRTGAKVITHTWKKSTDNIYL